MIIALYAIWLGGRIMWGKVVIYSSEDKILTVWETPDESDAFEYMPNYDVWVEVILSKGERWLERKA